MTDRVEVLLVETEPSTRSLVRHGLALEGVETISAESRSQARVVIDEPFEAVLIDSDLLDGEGCSLVEELLERLPHSRIILHGLRGSYPGLPAVDKCDVQAILKLLDLDRNEEMASAAVTARQALGRVHRHWIELCRWDPML
ncbi:MAG TPA: response regulator, partial [Acidimicrobiales bacterium]|nr:response regulator [Acidimicrobiales bacterium]